MVSAIFTLICLGGIAGAPRATAASPEPIGIEGARHLLARAGLGGTPDEFARFAVLDRRAAVKALFTAADRPQPPPPEWTTVVEPRRRRSDMTPEERRRALEQSRERGEELKIWWYQRMIQTDRPLVERMTLFWHNHFTSSLQKVKLPLLMYRQNELFRAHSCGNFRTLLHAVAKDPAMLIYLDTVVSNREQPNENFARELLELFTLGEGHYRERDIKEAARAFTGWKVDPRTGDFQLVRARHDVGPKSFLGRQGNLGGEQIIDILLEQPRLARFIVAKLWREFLSTEPVADDVERIAQTFRASGYELEPVIRALLESDAFWDPRERGAMIKSPVELLVGVARTFQLPLGEGPALVRLGRSLQQDLFNPPNVKGWPGGPSWISSTTLLIREQTLAQIGNETQPRRTLEPDAGMSGSSVELLRAWFDAIDPKPEMRAAAAIARLCPIPLVDPLTATDGVAIIRQILVDPVYQLK
ncbi:MAG: DUF1800 family protein [Planctomycetota bacterium]